MKPDWKKKSAVKKKHSEGGRGNDPGPWQDLCLCWAHYNWGSKANTCKPPCAQAGN